MVEQFGEKYVAKVVDVSLNGAHLKTEAELETDAPIKLHIIFDELSPPVDMVGKIVYHKNNDYGIECKEIDIDSMLHLRTILTLHNNDAEIIHQESQALWEKNAEELDS